MALRIFRGEDGRDWQAWDTRPQGRTVGRGLNAGWLSFEVILPAGLRRRANDPVPERRRIVPIPADWEDVAVEELRTLWASADRVVARSQEAAAASASQAWRNEHPDRRQQTG